MKVLSILFVSFLLLSSLATVKADKSAGSQIENEGRAELVVLMEKVVAASRIEVDRANGDAMLSIREKRYIQTLFSRILIRSDRCEEALQFLSHHAEIMASGIEQNIGTALSSKDRKCALSLAHIMWQRWDDPQYSSVDRMGLKFNAAAHLDAGGHPEGHSLFLRAEKELMATGNVPGIWSALLKTTTAYAETEKRDFYLEFLVSKLLDESMQPLSSRRRQILVVFAHEQRDDLLQKFVGKGSAEYSEIHAIVNSLADHSVAQKASGSLIVGFDGRPELNKAGLQSSLAKSDKMARMFRLLLMADGISAKLIEDHSR